ncbi:MAG: uracil-DNA glycosylase [Christensenellaceae bacterium]|nr:uracil-DNA glycosylase [Christensenellaceae bacterium]
MEQLKSRVDGCEACGLCQKRKTIVFGEGNPDTRIMFVGEGPGEREDEMGRPFVGPAGQLLDRMMAAIGLDRSNAYIANVVKCRPPHNRDPEPEEMNACRPYLDAQMDIIRPRVVVALGRIAMRELLKEQRGITKLHGKVFYRDGVFIVPTYHPSALLRSPGLKKEAWEDLKTVRFIMGEIEKNAGDIH